MGMPAVSADADVSDAALIRAARNDVAWAREALFRRHASLVSGMAFRLLGRDEGVDDLIQETFAQALSSLHRLESPETFPSWLGSIVVRTASKMLRHRQVLRRLGLFSATPVDMDELIARTAPPDASAELRAIYRVVDALPAKLRVTLILHRVEGATLEEVARMTRTSLSTAKRRLWEAESRLDRAFRQEPV